MKILAGPAALVGRFLLSIIFLISAYGKITGFKGSAEFMATKMPFSMPLIYIMLAGATTFEVVGGLSVLTGYKARFGAALRFLFLVPTTVIFHNVLVDPSQKNAFLKNAAILGALLLVMVQGSGPMSVDKPSEG